MKDGGPAFPTIVWGSKWDDGMTLRDYAEIKFTAAWVRALSARYNEDGYSDEAAAAEAARLGRIQADAMLAEREKEKP